MKHFLLIVDLQQGFLADGVTDHTKAMIDQVVRDRVFDCVISTVYRNYPTSPISELMGWKKLLTEEEQQVVGEAAAHADHVVYKSTYSAYSNELADWIKQENGGELPECVFIAGLDIECCVLMTAVDFFEAGIRPIVLTQYCGASGGEEAQHAGIRTLQSLIGANNIYYEPVASTADLDTILNQAKTAVYQGSCPTQTKAQALVELLSNKGWHISFAESCTGGKAAAGIVDVASASAVFDASFVTYANDAKINYLGVSPQSIEAHGVVSETVALEMAVGIAKANHAQVGVGISGIAGPSGGSASKPVGMVCFGFYVNGKTVTKTVQFGDIGRNAVRQAAVDFVYDTLLLLLSENS